MTTAIKSKKIDPAGLAASCGNTQHRRILRHRRPADKALRA
jgi:hypothetical protein